MRGSDSRLYHALVMHAMLIRQTKRELAEFGQPDFVIMNAGAFPSNRLTTSVDFKTSVCRSLEDRELTSWPSPPAGSANRR
jgi:phosphoenolpyruvate carboxykinase (ATP)